LRFLPTLKEHRASYPQCVAGIHLTLSSSPQVVSGDPSSFVIPACLWQESIWKNPERFPIKNVGNDGDGEEFPIKDFGKDEAKRLGVAGMDGGKFFHSQHSTCLPFIRYCPKDTV
jgi:hypothetical protein